MRRAGRRIVLWAHAAHAGRRFSRSSRGLVQIRSRRGWRGCARTSASARRRRRARCCPTRAISQRRRTRARCGSRGSLSSSGRAITVSRFFSLAAASPAGPCVWHEAVAVSHASRGTAASCATLYCADPVPIWSRRRVLCPSWRGIGTRRLSDPKDPFFGSCALTCDPADSIQRGVHADPNAQRAADCTCRSRCDWVCRGTDQ